MNSLASLQLVFYFWMTVGCYVCVCAVRPSAVCRGIPLPPPKRKSRSWSRLVWSWSGLVWSGQVSQWLLLLLRLCVSAVRPLRSLCSGTDSIWRTIDHRHWHQILPYSTVQYNTPWHYPPFLSPANSIDTGHSDHCRTASSQSNANSIDNRLLFSVHTQQQQH